MSTRSLHYYIIRLSLNDVGFIIGSQMYFDISNEANFTQNAPKVVKEVQKLMNLNGAGTEKLSVKAAQGDRVDGHANMMNEPREAAVVKSKAPVSFAQNKTTNEERFECCKNWSVLQVNKWLKDHHLEFLLEKYCFEGFLNPCFILF